MPAGESSAGYFDSSVLVKCYVTERGSEAATRAIGGHAVVSSALARVELAGALRRYGETVPRSTIAAIDARLGEESREWWLVGVDGEVVRRAEGIAATAPARALDAVHIASALQFEEDSGVRMPFITADDRQRRAAIAFGLEVVFIE